MQRKSSSAPRPWLRGIAGLVLCFLILCLGTPARGNNPFPPCDTPGIHIHDIQGAHHLSRCAGQNVSGVTGIVTAVRRSGFYLQDPQPDTAGPTGFDFTPLTSEGIFIHTAGDKPNVGDRVSIDGLVEEDRSRADELSLTRIELSRFHLISSGNPLPAPQLIGSGGGLPIPPKNIDNDAGPSVEDPECLYIPDPDNIHPDCIFEPERDAIDFYESLEGMRIRLINPLVVGATDDEGHIVVVPENAAGYAIRILQRGILLRPDDPNTGRIVLDDSLDSVGRLDVPVGTLFSGDAVGVLHYSGGMYRIVFSQNLPETVLPVPPLPDDIAATAPPERLTAATYNVHNLSAISSQERFDLLAAHITRNLRSPDLLALEEIQDDNGGAVGGVSAGQTLGLLTAAIAAQGGPAYLWLQIDPLNNQDGGEPNANIRQVILYNPARLQPIAAPPGDATTPVGLSPAGPPHLTLNPGRIAPQDPAFNSSRKPLAAEFNFQGRTIFVIACHLVSKSGDDPLFGPYQPPRLSTLAKRTGQTARINAFARTILDRDPFALILTLGDMNDFEWSRPLTTLETGEDGVVELANLAAALPSNEFHYTYIYEGNSQALDHIFVSPAWAVGGLAEGGLIHAEDIHLNAERHEQDLLRASDHDPVWAALTPPPLFRAYLPAISR
jgi:hypothetical protein